MSAFVPSRRSGITMLPSIAAPRHGFLAALAIGFAAAAFGAMFGARLLWPAKAELAELAGEESGNPSVVLRDSRAERRLGYLTVVGTVANRSGKRLRNVEAVVEYFDSAGKLVRLDSGLIELPVIAPSSESPFEVHSRDSAGITSYRIRFRTLLGSGLPSARESR